MTFLKAPLSGASRILYIMTLSALGFACLLSASDRPAAPKLTKPVMFNTPEADGILAALRVFPPNNPWNEDISKLPVLKNSKEMIATIGPEKSLAYNLDMAFILVPGNQPRVNAKIVSYAGESDPGPYPIPDNAPIEGWPLDGRTLTAAQAGTEDADRHLIVVDPENRMLYEFYQGP